MSTILRVYRCWKCKREVTLSPEEYQQERAGTAFRRPLSVWKCDCGGSLHVFRLAREFPA